MALVSCHALLCLIAALPVVTYDGTRFRFRLISGHPGGSAVKMTTMVAAYVNATRVAAADQPLELGALQAEATKEAENPAKEPFDGRA